MFSSRWTTEEELKEKLTKISNEEEISKSGIPLMYDKDSIYVDTSESHSIIIGTTGSGKTQATLLPLTRLTIRSGESFVVNDVKGEILECLSHDLEKFNYNVIKINLTKPQESNFYNIFKLSFDLYKNNEKDHAVEVLENTIRYLIMEPENNPNADTFWENSATDFFTGVMLYLFNTSDNVPTLKEAYNLAMNFDAVALDKIDKTSTTYVYLATTVQAPPETKLSIIATLSQKIKPLISREQMSEIFNKSDFDFKDLLSGKTALFIITGESTYISSRIIPIMVTQLYYVVTYAKNKEKRINILIDEFEKLLPIKNFEIMADYSRSYNLKFTIYLKSFLELKNKYGQEKAELIKISFGTIIYLLANDMDTLITISDLCGNIKENNESHLLCSPEELKLLNTFEAVVLIPRLYPIKTKLLPDYKYPWNN